MNNGKSEIVTVLIIVTGFLSAGGAYGEDDVSGSSAAGFGTYQDVLLEKVGEVSEIRYRELVESKSDRGDIEKALMRLALYRYFQGDFAGSEFFLRRLISRFEDTDQGREARIWLGRTYLARGEYRSALVELRGGLEALEDVPRSGKELAGRYLFWIGEAYRQSGKAADARHYFESFLKRIPGHPLTSVLRERLAETYRALGMDPPSTGMDRSPADAHAAAGGEVETVAVTGGTYRVRIASFTVRENASALVRSLGENGFETEIEEVTLESGKYYRVVLGGYKDRDRAEEIAKKVRLEGYPKAYVEEE